MYEYLFFIGLRYFLLEKENVTNPGAISQTQDTLDK